MLKKGKTQAKGKTQRKESKAYVSSVTEPFVRLFRSGQKG